MRAVKRIAVLVSGGGTNLQALIDAQRRGEIVGGEIAAVISSKPGAYALERARRAGIPGYVVSRKDYDTNQAMTAALVDKLSGLDIDLVVLAGFMVIFTREMVDAYPNAILNVHPALIPSFCGKGYYGLHVHERALEYGVKVSGATVHFVSEECDGGPIVLQKAVAVEENDTPETLQRRIMEQAEWVILPRAVSLFCQGRLKVEGRTVRILKPLNLSKECLQ
jgi:phosphoribosylglycinamide formyltransferase-1